MNIGVKHASRIIHYRRTHFSIDRQDYVDLRVDYPT